MWGVVALGFAAGCAVDAAVGGAITAHYHLSIALAGILLVGALIRVVADFLGMVCNARMQERVVFRRQLTAFAVGGGLSVLLAWRFGLFGLACGNFAGSALYLLLIADAVRKEEKRR